MIVRNRLQGIQAFFAEHPSLNLSRILDYIFDSVKFDIDPKKSLRDNAQVILTRKETYRTITNFVYSLVDRPQNYKDYSEGQLVSLISTRELLKERK